MTTPHPHGARRGCEGCLQVSGTYSNVSCPRPPTPPAPTPILSWMLPTRIPTNMLTKKALLIGISYRSLEQEASQTAYRCPSLQQIRALDTSSPQFLGQLATFLDGEEFKDYARNLQDDDARWLIDSLDWVCNAPCI